VTAAPAAGRGIVTPEAVLLEFETAGVASRAIARALDSFVVVIGAGFVIAIAASIVNTEGAAVVLLLLVGFLGIFGYPAVTEAFSNGRTVGKAALGLRVVTVEGAPVRFRHAAIRSALQTVDFFLIPLGVIATASALPSPLDQRVGDRIAGTMVLRARSGAREAAAVAFPSLPGYDDYVAGLDVTALDFGQYEVLRSFLTRVDQLTPRARAALAERLCAGVEAATRQGRAPSVHPEHHLASVAAAYQRRHGGPAVAWGMR
jgi:uncharacterized RDD family membrane protein YckC